MSLQYSLNLSTVSGNKEVERKFVITLSKINWTKLYTDSHSFYHMHTHTHPTHMYTHLVTNISVQQIIGGMVCNISPSLSRSLLVESVR